MKCQVTGPRAVAAWLTCEEGAMKAMRRQLFPHFHLSSFALVLSPPNTNPTHLAIHSIVNPDKLQHFDRVGDLGALVRADRRAGDD